MSIKTITLTDRLYRYMLSVSLREPEVLRKLREETEIHPLGRMQIAPEQGQFMAMLVKLIGARRCLEIGVFTGYSSLSVALALPSDGKLIALDMNADWTAIARRYWQLAGVADKIELRLAPALTSLEQLEATNNTNAFDFIFIDADKANYTNYFGYAMRLLRPGGLIAIDNVLWSGDVADPSINDKETSALRAFNEQLHHDKRIDLSMIPIGDGLTLARKL